MISKHETLVDSFSLSSFEEFENNSGTWKRVFSTGGVHPFDTVNWKIVDAEITNSKGESIFKQQNVEVPEWWNQNTINIVADKFFRVINGVRENSVKQMFTRVSTVLKNWGIEQNFFKTAIDAEVYEQELLYALVHQFGAFNSPVWFNLGVPGRKQAASACFISSVEDTVEGIMEFQAAEAAIFRGGSGSGSNLSSLRSSYEKISSGSYTCGPISWMAGNNAYAGAFKSGGSTRNAAKMVVLDMAHPDILETKDGRPGFIRCKAAEEKLAHDLVKIGYGVNYDDPNGAYKRVGFQNANHSVSIPDDFMKSVESGGTWETKSVHGNETITTYNSKELWREIAEAAYICGDPGVQFSDTINSWHTTPNSGRIRSTNPCFAAETKIATEFGLVAISDLYERILDGKVNVSVHFGDRIEKREAIIFPTGINPILQVKLKSGRVINVTPNHNFLLRDGVKKPAAELAPGDSVDIQCDQGSFGSYDCGLSNPMMWYRIAGFVVGDGWMTKYKMNSKQHADRGWKSEFFRQEVGMCFGKHDKDMLQKVESFLKLNDVAYTLKRQNGSVGESPDYLRIRCSEIFSAMENIACPAGSRSHTKRIQKGVFEASRLHQFAFLSGLFSADGSFRLASKGNGGNIPSRELRLSSTSSGLLQDVQALLLNLGIKSNIIYDRNCNRSSKFEYTSSSGETHTYNSKRNVHELFVYGHSLRKLRDGMKEAGGMLSDRKQSQLDDFLPEGYSSPIHDIWHDEVISVSDTGREELTYNMTEFDTHTIIAEGIRIPQCSEFTHVDDTACNLCAINLTKFFSGTDFNFSHFIQATRLFSVSQMIIVDKAEYPTQKIADNSKKLRPIGTNYGDLGSLLMKLGHSYDSDAGRAVAARLASLMTGVVYLQSIQIASRLGSFPEFEKNKVPMLSVMNRHKNENNRILEKYNQHYDPISQDLSLISDEIWDSVCDLGNHFGFYTSQATLQAPLGTISYLMGMNTTGIEPAFSLVSYKKLVGGGFMTLVNASVSEALANLGYSESEVESIKKHVELTGSIEESGIRAEHLPVFDCAMPAFDGGRYLSPMAHLQMMAAIQPLITCAISKTVNLPKQVTVEEIEDVYFQSWKLGLKCVALYRDGSKASQPLAAKEEKEEKTEISVAQEPALPKTAVRDRMPMDVNGWRHKFVIDGYKGYIIVDEYPDGRPGEVFLKLGKPGSTVSGLIDGFTQLLSICLQYGIPLPKLIDSFIDTRFEPAGMTSNKNIRFAKSLYDYLFKVLDVHYHGGEISGLASKIEKMNISGDIQEGISKETRPSIIPELDETDKIKIKSIDAPPCNKCGSITQRNGSCYLCSSCGSTTGCS